jgi:gas vesicle protein
MPQQLPPHLTEILLACVIGLLFIVALIQILLFRRKDSSALVRESFASMEEHAAATEKALRDEIAQTLADLRELREDMANRIHALMKSMIPASTVTRSIDQKLENVKEAVEARLQVMQEESGKQLESAGENTLAIATGQREEVAAALADIKETLVNTLDHYTQHLHKNIGQSLADNTSSQRSQIAAIVEHLTDLIKAAEQKLEAYRQETDARIKQIHEESAVVQKFSMATRAFGATLANEFDHVEHVNDNNHMPSR